VPSTLLRIVSVDPGHKRTPAGSPSVIQVWVLGDDRFYLIDQWRERAGFSDFRSAFVRLCRKHRPKIALIEDTGYGPSLIDKPPAFGWLTIVACTPDSRSKRERLAAHLKAIRAGCICLPEGADWTDDYVEEFLTFPANCTDQVDATVQFLDKARSTKWEGLRPPKVAIGAVASHLSPMPATPAPLSRAIGAVACASEWRR
jgi:predicted phage terminase large subunit-like protein